MAYKLIDGKAQAQIIREDVRNRVAALKKAGWFPHLVSVEIGTSPAAALYINNQRRVCSQVDVEYETRPHPAETTQGEALAIIQALNVDPRVTGIILQRPIPKHLDLEALQNAIHCNKDVEGMNAINIGKIVYGNFALGPCTSLAAVALLKSTGLQLAGLEVVVVGHSEIVGKPVALVLMEQLATVTICHHATHNLTYHTRQADALIVAVGKPGLIRGDMVKPGAAVIDIGINQIEVDTPEGGKEIKIVGDVDFDSVYDVAGWLTPVPGGVGPVTVAMLLRNTVLATERQKQKYEETMNP
jgi:methylenetetrahydrofolate dehydrogenase (NADP+) / methenyltetrahydrofolate cyclohydrolase